MSALQDFLWGADRVTSYSEVAKQLGMTEGAVRVAVHRLRQNYQKRLRLEVAQTVGSEAEIEEELRHLISVLSQ